MKKYLSIISFALIAITCLIPLTAFAEDNTQYDAEFTQEEFEASEHVYAVSIQPYSSKLITNHGLGISKNGNNLLISGFTQGSDKVVKCGFSKVIIQRRASSSASWSKYKEFSDLCNNDKYYKLSKRIPVDKGYQYRVVATHYAKKSLLSTQKLMQQRDIYHFKNYFYKYQLFNM